MTDFNNNRNNTKNNKTCKIEPIQQYILDTLNKDQTIRRLLRYNSKTPLADIGISYEDEKPVEQPDLTTDLTKETKEGKKVLFDISFNPDVEEVYQNYMFVDLVGIKDYGINGEFVFMIDILSPDNYNSLNGYGKQRLYGLLNRCVELFDGYILENTDIVDEVGNVGFEIDVNGMVKGRNSKANNFIVLSFPLKVNYISSR